MTTNKLYFYKGFFNSYNSTELYTKFYKEAKEKINNKRFYREIEANQHYSSQAYGGGGLSALWTITIDITDDKSNKSTSNKKSNGLFDKIFNRFKSKKKPFEFSIPCEDDISRLTNYHILNTIYSACQNSKVGRRRGRIGG